MSRRLTVEADGGSRGNPGVAGYGALVRDTETGALLAERAEPLGKASNNVAEYRGLIAGLEAAAHIDPAAVVLARMDSKLVVEQMSGRWKIKHEDMKRLALQARDVAAGIVRAGGAVRYEWIPREKNKDADLLSNVAMDGRTVHRYLEDDTEAPEAAADAPTAATTDACAPVAAMPGSPVRVVLVAQAQGEAARSAAAAVAHLLGGAPRCLLTAPSDVAVEAAAEVGSALGAEAVVDGGWGEEDDALLAAWDRVVQRGGTTVVVCAPDAVRTVLGHLLGVPAERRSRLAVAPGSLAGVEVWDGDEVSVAFTNRT
ncbi:reverse transcriptase-like protein [Oryzobacter telluris]|uniref:reverse transcriptase-like protein n=1 Tax=Oryzobacter telluris TaxID=3149179 RepID=UPI00370DC32E